MIVGLGSGSTARLFIAALGQALAAGKLRDIRGIPTSQRSDQLAQSLGIPLVTFAQCPSVDLTVDGADEVDPQLNLIKGHGGSLLREKIVAQNSKKLLIVADISKKVSHLGTRFALPVEVASFGFDSHVPFFRSLGAEPVLRTIDGKPFITDNSNFIYDCRFAQIDDPAALQSALRQRAGIVETGLFLGLAQIVLIATEKDVETLIRK
jgi:ribose 5-phosphate isomerase A